MAGYICDVPKKHMRPKFYDSLSDVSKDNAAGQLGVSPGSRNKGYGLVVIPMLIRLVSGLSYIFASQ